MIEKEDPAFLIPHKGRMLLLSRINEYNLEERSLSAEYDITRDCLFYDPLIGGVPSWVAFEFLAQSIAALSGISSRLKGEKPKIGFILSVSSLQMDIPFFPAGSTVEIRVKESSNLDQVSNFDGEAFLEGRKVLEGKLMVMNADDEHIKSVVKEDRSIG